MREFAASYTWKDDRKKKKDSDTCRKQKRDTDDCAGESWETGEWDGERDKNKEQMRSPKAEEWDIRAVQTGIF